MYLRKLCIVVKYAVLINKDLLATVGSTFTVGAEWGLGAPFRGDGGCTVRGRMRLYCENKVSNFSLSLSWGSVYLGVTGGGHRKQL